MLSRRSLRTSKIGMLVYTYLSHDMFSTSSMGIKPNRQDTKRVFMGQEQ